MHLFLVTLLLLVNVLFRFRIDQQYSLQNVVNQMDKFILIILFILAAYRCHSRQ